MRKIVFILLFSFAFLHAEEVIGNSGASSSILKETIETILFSIITTFYPVVIALGMTVIRFKAIAKKFYTHEIDKLNSEIEHFLTNDVIKIKIDTRTQELIDDIEETKKSLRRIS